MKRRRESGKAMCTGKGKAYGETGKCQIRRK